MAERSKKFSELEAATNLAASDLLVLVNQPGTANVSTKKITATNLFANVSINTTFKQTVTANTLFVANLNVVALNLPATASANGTTGEIRVSNSHIYVCVANNTWKRTELSTW